MAKLELTYHQAFPEDGDPGWHASWMPDGRRVHATPMRCNPGEPHWAGSVEDLDRCECNGDGTCNLCLIRENDGLVFTRVTGCYRSANSAIRALQQWEANPDAPPPPAPFNCSWTTMQAVLCENVPNALAMPLGTTESIYRPSLPTPPADLCENHHAVLLRYWATNDLAPTPCPKCGQEPTYVHMGMGVDPRSDDLRGLPAQAARQWIVENSEPDELGAIPIPEERRGGLFTHVRYAPDCEHDEGCDCADDESITWVMDEFNTGPIRDEQDDVQQEHSAQVESQPEEATDDDDDDYCIQTFRWDITPELLDECSESGHRRQAWLVISGKQKEAVTCPTCGQIPDFFDISTSGEQGLDFDAISETLNETHMASHEVFVDESEEDEHDVDDVTFTVQSHVFQHAEEWPKPGSTNLTRLPYPGDDAITLRWFRDEWNQRDSLDEDELLLDPHTREPLTDETLRMFMVECHDEGFSYESSATDIINATRGIDDDDDGC